MKKGTVDTAVSQNDSTYKGTTKFNKDGTISIKDTVQNPARALEYMIDGLEKQDKRDDFVIDMRTYGDYNSGNCHGCAATCALQEIAKKNFTTKNTGIFLHTRAEHLNFDKQELHIFEIAIDDARRGNLNKLYKFFNDNRIYNFQNSMLYKLRSDDWKENLHFFKSYVKLLKKNNPNWN